MPEYFRVSPDHRVTIPSAVRKYFNVEWFEGTWTTDGMILRQVELTPEMIEQLEKENGSKD